MPSFMKYSKHYVISERIFHIKNVNSTKPRWRDYSFSRIFYYILWSRNLLDRWLRCLLTHWHRCTINVISGMIHSPIHWISSRVEKLNNISFANRKYGGTHLRWINNRQLIWFVQISNLNLLNAVSTWKKSDKWQIIPICFHEFQIIQSQMWQIGSY